MLRGWVQQHNERTGINELEYRAMQITQSKQQRENRLERKKNCSRNLWDYNKRCYILVIGVLEGEKKEHRLKSTQMKAPYICPRDISLEVQEAEQTVHNKIHIRTYN